MTGYRVRFSAQSNELHAPEPRTPSPTSSASSACSSSCPLTPPPLNYFRSPYARSPLPPVPEPSCKPTNDIVGPVRINPIIGLAHKPVIEWDLTLPWTSITTARHQRLSSHALSEPATNPPRSSLTVVSLHSPWSMAVFASSSKPDAYVTVADVLSTLHRALRMAVVPDGHDSLQSHDVQRLVNAVYESSIDEGKYSARAAGCPIGRNRFMGLSSTRFGPGIWALNVS